ncbi:MAG TPA: sulfotransferase family 2 domain-containing protein [Bacteroidia bacterium]|nr:sulfotransferase family 2 domain-containing protein [Bacteroidia bacterium]
MIEFISIHIPKTAGRSFLAVLKSVYGENNVAHFDRKLFPNKSIPEIEQFLAALDTGKKVIHGHFTYKEIRELHLKYQPKIITWVRNPVERVISNYNFFKKRIAEAPVDSELKLRSDETLLQYAEMETSRNRMSKFIDGLPPDDFFFVGIMEYFEKDLRTLGEKLNWKSFDIPKLNVNRGLHSIETYPPEVLNKIALLNSLDTELYRKVSANHNNAMN